MADPKIKNPNWTRDEIILALDLYFELNGKNEDPTNKKIVELSSILNKLSGLEYRSTTFRNPDSVAMKLQNLRYFDPERTGGLPAGSKLDEKVLREFYNDRGHFKRDRRSDRRFVK
jgi:5-methylcytosine-specific restriction protein A